MADGLPVNRSIYHNPNRNGCPRREGEGRCRVLASCSLISCRLPMAWAGDTALSQIRKADKDRGRGEKGVRSAVFGHFRGEFVCLFDPFCMRLGTAQFGLELGRNLLNASLSRSLWLPQTTTPTPSPQRCMYFVAAKLYQ